MQLVHIPLLEKQRKLHDIPRGMERFNEYLRVIVNENRDAVQIPPLLVMNPMGREHVAERLDELIALGAEEIATSAVEVAAVHFSQQEISLKHGIVVADDIRGGWTNRYTTEAASRFATQDQVKQEWISTIWWVSEIPSAERIRQEVLASIYRAVHYQAYGAPKTLRQMMRQEGSAGAFAGMLPHLDEEDLEYSHYILEPLLDSTSYPVCFAAMYGDLAARTVGYEPLGLSDRAGFAVALAEIIRRK